MYFGSHSVAEEQREIEKKMSSREANREPADLVVLSSPQCVFNTIATTQRNFNTPEFVA